MKPEVIIRFSDYAEQPSDKHNVVPIRRIVGYIEGQNILPLLDALDLDANPRSARVGAVTDEILSTLHNASEFFHLRSKGILIGTSEYRALDRGRFALAFTDPQVEGILDGGHNALALGLYFLSEHLSERDFNRIKYWDEMKIAWQSNRKAIESNKNKHKFLVPVELLVPADPNEADEGSFLMPLLDICAARNNNAALTQEAKSEKRGFYDEMRNQMPETFARRVEWRPNTWEDESEDRPIKVRDLVAQSWIPLNLLSAHGALPSQISVTPQNIYRNKGECSQKFEQLMMRPEVTRREDDGRHVLIHDGVKSALRIVADLPALFDDLYKLFPEAYNNRESDERRRFGSNGVVQIYDPKRRAELKSQGKDASSYIAIQPVTPFFREAISYRYPDGLIAPLLYGLQGIMAVKKGKVVWAVKGPRDFVAENMTRIAKAYSMVLDFGKAGDGSWDPQRIAKNPTAHEFAVKEFRSALIDFELESKRAR
jgi:hypothetical protein